MEQISTQGIEKSPDHKLKKYQRRYSESEGLKLERARQRHNDIFGEKKHELSPEDRQQLEEHVKDTQEEIQQAKEMYEKIAECEEGKISECLGQLNIKIDLAGMHNPMHNAEWNNKIIKHQLEKANVPPGKELTDKNMVKFNTSRLMSKFVKEHKEFLAIYEDIKDLYYEMFKEEEKSKNWRKYKEERYRRKYGIEYENILEARIRYNDAFREKKHELSLEDRKKLENHVKDTQEKIKQAFHMYNVLDRKTGYTEENMNRIINTLGIERNDNTIYNALKAFKDDNKFIGIQSRKSQVKFNTEKLMGKIEENYKEFLDVYEDIKRLYSEAQKSEPNLFSVEAKNTKKTVSPEEPKVQKPMSTEKELRETSQTTDLTDVNKEKKGKKEKKTRKSISVKTDIMRRILQLYIYIRRGEKKSKQAVVENSGKGSPTEKPVSSDVEKYIENIKSISFKSAENRYKRVRRSIRSYSWSNENEERIKKFIEENDKKIQDITKKLYEDLRVENCLLSSESELNKDLRDLKIKEDISDLSLNLRKIIGYNELIKNIYNKKDKRYNIGMLMDSIEADREEFLAVCDAIERLHAVKIRGMKPLEVQMSVSKPAVVAGSSGGAVEKTPQTGASADESEEGKKVREPVVESDQAGPSGKPQVDEDALSTSSSIVRQEALKTMYHLYAGDKQRAIKGKREELNWWDLRGQVMTPRRVSRKFKKVEASDKLFSSNVRREALEAKYSGYAGDKQRAVEDAQEELNWWWRKLGTIGKNRAKRRVLKHFGEWDKLREEQMVSDNPLSPTVIPDDTDSQREVEVQGQQWPVYKHVQDILEGMEGADVNQQALRYLAREEREKQASTGDETKESDSEDGKKGKFPKNRRDNTRGSSEKVTPNKKSWKPIIITDDPDDPDNPDAWMGKVLVLGEPVEPVRIDEEEEEEDLNTGNFNNMPQRQNFGEWEVLRQRPFTRKNDLDTSPPKRQLGVRNDDYPWRPLDGGHVGSSTSDWMQYDPASFLVISQDGGEAYVGPSTSTYQPTFRPREGLDALEEESYDEHDGPLGRRKVSSSVPSDSEMLDTDDAVAFSLVPRPSTEFVPFQGYNNLPPITTRTQRTSLGMDYPSHLNPPLTRGTREFKNPYSSQSASVLGPPTLTGLPIPNTISSDFSRVPSSRASFGDRGRTTPIFNSYPGSGGTVPRHTETYPPPMVRPRPPSQTSATSNVDIEPQTDPSKEKSRSRTLRSIFLSKEK